MYKYSVYGIGIESQIELPSASEISHNTENKIHCAADDAGRDIDSSAYNLR